MDYFLLVLAVILLIVGFLGSFLPVVPGPPLCFISLVLIHFTRFAEFQTSTFIVLGILTVIVAVLDYLVPAWGTKKFGGSKYGSWGSIIGLIFGTLFFTMGPLGIIGIIGGPFLGAYVGELFAGKNSNLALRAAYGSFIGFLAGTFIKLALCTAMIVIFIRALIK